MCVRVYDKSAHHCCAAGGSLVIRVKGSMDRDSKQQEDITAERHTQGHTRVAANSNDN